MPGEAIKFLSRADDTLKSLPLTPSYAIGDSLVRQMRCFYYVYFVFAKDAIRTFNARDFQCTDLIFNDISLGVASWYRLKMLVTVFASYIASARADIHASRYASLSGRREAFDDTLLIFSRRIRASIAADFLYYARSRR